MNEDDEAAALAHQQECEQQEWEELHPDEVLKKDPDYHKWANELDALARNQEKVS